jgi:membrane protease YdiL (CAAX protease family)
LEAVVIFTGLILAWPLWRFLRRCHPTPRPSDHRRHLRRLWSPALTLLCFSFASGVGLGVGAMANPAASSVASITTKGTEVYWWSFMAVFLGITTAAALMVPMVMRWFMAPELGNLRQVFDLRWRDFREGRWWFLGIAGGSSIFCLELLLQYTARWLGFPTHVSDHLSRSFESLGSLALPFGFVWGVMMAPWMEELVNRGFLFTALRNQFGTLWGAAISSAIFAWYHFYGWLGTTEVFLFGMVHCFIYQRTRSLAASMILHGCVNLPLVIIRWLEWSA